MNLGKVAGSVAVALLAVGGDVHAQEAAPAEKPALLLPGLGHHRHTIKTRSAEAQQLFDQGLTLVYGFNHDEAIRSFQRAAELDPDAVMPLWGIAYALGPNINIDVDPEREKAAFEATRKALKVAKVPRTTSELTWRRWPSAIPTTPRPT